MRKVIAATGAALRAFQEEKDDEIPPPADEPPPTLPVAPSREPAARVPRLEAERAPEVRAEPEEAGEVGEELDAVQAEIARLKAELGV